MTHPGNKINPITYDRRSVERVRHIAEISVGGKLLHVFTIRMSYSEHATLTSSTCHFHAGLLYFQAGNDIPAPENRIEVRAFGEITSRLSSIPVLAFLVQCFIFLWH